MHLTHRRGGRDRSRPRAGLEIAVRGGGHSVAGMSSTDGGLVVDLRAMNSVEVDVAARTVHVAGGATMSDLDRALAPHGLVAVGGRVSTTGVGGFALGSGAGWLDRKFGLACDNLLSVELALSPRPGDLVTASEHENPELFWALHGGGGNFGVAVSRSSPASSPLPPPRLRRARRLPRGRARLRGGGGCPAAAHCRRPRIAVQAIASSPPYMWIPCAPGDSRWVELSLCEERLRLVVPTLGGAVALPAAPQPRARRYGAIPRAARAPR